MAILPKPFNAYEVDPASVSAQLPVSDAKGHLCIINASEFKPSKNNPNNGYLELTLECVDGQAKGQTGAWRLNLFHENPQTTDIANRQLSALCHVTGQMQINDSSQLHNIPFRAIVGLQKKQKADDPDYTEVKGVLDVNGEKPGHKPAPQQQAPNFAQQPAQPQGNFQQQPQSAAPAWAPQAQPPQQQVPGWAPQQQASPAPSAAPWATK